MEQQILRKNLLAWSKININLVANAFYKISSGDARKLKGNFSTNGGIFGELSVELFKVDHEFHRLLLHTIWNDNRHSVKELYFNLASDGERRPRKYIPSKLRAQATTEAYCWCNKLYTDSDLECVQCDTCDLWFHCICSGLPEATADSLPTFKCVPCQGSPKIPKIFTEFTDTDVLIAVNQKQDECGIQKPNITSTSTEKKVQKDDRAREQETQHESTEAHSWSKDNDLGETGDSNKENIVREVTVIKDDAYRISKRAEDRGNKGLDQIKINKEDLAETNDLEGCQKNVATEIMESAQTDINEASYVGIKLGPTKCALGDIAKKLEDRKLKKHDTDVVHIKGNPKLCSKKMNLGRAKLTSVFVDRKLVTGKKRECTERSDAEDFYSIMSDTCDNNNPYKSVEQIPNDVVKKEVRDTSKIPHEFLITLTSAEWNNISETQFGKTHVLKKSYTDTFVSKFNQLNKVCLPMVHNKGMNLDYENSNGAFLRVYTHCGAEECTAHHTFSINRVPKKGANVDIQVRLSKGKIFHYVNTIVKRPLKGEARQEAKKALSTVKASNYRRNQFINADFEQLVQGNYNIVKTLQVFRQVAADADYHRDVLIDLLMTYLKQKQEIKGKKLDGYIQLLSIFPLIVVMFTEKQLRILNCLTSNDTITAFLDATGSIPKRLPDPLENGLIMYYALVVKSPVVGEPPLPILEFYTNSHNTGTVQYCLQYMLDEYKRVFKVRGRNYGFRRFEIDFSKVMLSACTRVFDGTDVEGYLLKLWRLLCGELVGPIFPVHVCRVHVVRFFIKKAKQIYKCDIAALEFWKTWIYAFINGKDMFTFHRRTIDAMTVTCNYYRTKNVKDVIKNIGQCTSRTGKELWKDLKFSEISKQGDFWERSPFGYYAKLISEKILEKDYLERKKTVHTTSYEQIVDATTNAIENWIKIFKVDLLGGEKDVKLPRLVRKNEGFIAGGAIQLAVALKNLDSVEMVDELEDELEPHTIDEEDDLELFLLDPGFESDDEELVKPVHVAEHALHSTKSASKKKAAEKPRNNKTTSQKRKSHRKEDKVIKKLKATLSVDSKPKAPKSKCKDKGQKGGCFKTDPDINLYFRQKSPELETEGFKEHKRPPKNSEDRNPVFSMPAVPWGATFTYEGKNFRFTNTCNFDCTMQILYYLKNYVPAANAFFNSVFGLPDSLRNKMQRIFGYMDQGQISEAKRIWVTDLLNLQLTPNMDLWEEEREYGLQPIQSWFESFYELSHCKSSNCSKRNATKKRLVSLPLLRAATTQSSFQRLINRGYDKESYCKFCFGDVTIKYEPVEDGLPDLLVYVLDGFYRNYLNTSAQTGNKIYALEDELKKEQIIHGVRYEVCAYSMYTGNHYYAVLWNGKTKITYNGLGSPILKDRTLVDNSSSVSAVWLVRSS